jgi:hypothetical protein
MPYEQLSWNPGSDPKEPTPIARSTHNSRTQESRNLISDPNYLAVLRLKAYYLLITYKIIN